jgi:hypothetical protein
MKVIDVVAKLRASPKFKSWQAKNKDAKLVHIFLLLEPDRPIMYDIGFYDYKKELMTSFVVDEEAHSIEQSETKDIFKQEEDGIKPLDEARIKVCFTDACKACRELQQTKYKQHNPMKEVVILQHLPIGQVWNITYITTTMQTLNMKIDAETGKVVEEKLHQIFGFDKPEK